MAKINFHQAWKNIFERYKLLETIKKDGFVDISADAIKAVDNKEPRNLTKIDFREKLPHIMKEEGLSILAIKNGLYRIAKNDPFIDIAEEISTKVITLDVPQNISTIDPFNIKSESAALDIAMISGMHRRVFQEESQLTVRGRLRGSLNFHIADVAYNVEGVQIEVDGGYESKSALHLIEAKIGYSNNINIRQLLYPQLYWERELKGKKKIKSYLFYLQNDIFRFIPFYTNDTIGYVDYENEMAFRFKEALSNFSIYDIAVNSKDVDTSVPFPQADRFETLHTMILLLSQNRCLSKEEFSTHFDIVERQIDYYFSALKWLKVAKEDHNCLVLTPKGEEIVNLPFRKRVEVLAKTVFSDPIFNAVLHNKDINSNYFYHYNMYSESTIKRRLGTVRAWIKYLKTILEQDESWRI